MFRGDGLGDYTLKAKIIPYNSKTNLDFCGRRGIQLVFSANITKDWGGELKNTLGINFERHGPQFKS